MARNLAERAPAHVLGADARDQLWLEIRLATRTRRAPARDSRLLSPLGEVTLELVDRDQP